MPTSCHHFALLQRRIVELSNQFVCDQLLNEQANPATFQPDIDRLAAYRLLVHAEIEDFLESKAKEGLNLMETQITIGSRWMRRYPGFSFLNIVLKQDMRSIDLTDAKGLLNYVKDTIAASRKAIADNNGIKVASFAFLSICSGKTLDEIDNFLSGSLNSYGKNRGEIAHRSVTRSTSIQAPSAEFASANTIVQNLAAYFDVCP